VAAGTVQENPAHELGGEPGRSELDRLGHLHRALRTPSLVAGLLVVGTILFLVLLAPVISGYSPVQQNLLATFQGPSSAHLLGTDDLGRDVWTRLLYGGRTDIEVGLLAIIGPFTTGSMIGIMAGYFGGWLDAVIGRIVDMVLAFPFYVLIIALVFVVGEGTHGIYIAFLLTDWVVYARITRAATLVARQQDWMQAAVAGGLRNWRVVGRHLLPNVIAQPIVYAMSDVVFVILAIVTLGYLGLGIPPPTADWGSMIQGGQVFLTTHPWLSTVPGIAVVITALGFSLLGDGLADYLRPAP